MRVYLAGPMRGYPRHNFPAFFEAAAILRANDFEVVSPAEKDVEGGFDPAYSAESQGFDLKAAMRWDLTQVLAVDAVVALDGWEESLGAMAEVATARAVGTPVYEFDDLPGTLLAAVIAGTPR